MNEPTAAQIQEFWEGYGWFKWGSVWILKVGKEQQTSYSLPPINLNNLFKYAVPKLQDKGHQIDLLAYEHKGYTATVYKECFSQRGSDGYDPYLEPISQVRDDDPALALFWALYKVGKQ